MWVDCARVYVEPPHQIVSDKVLWKHTLDSLIDNHCWIQNHHAGCCYDLGSAWVGTSIAPEPVDLCVPCVAREEDMDRIDHNHRIPCDSHCLEVYFVLALQKPASEGRQLSNIPPLGINNVPPALLIVVVDGFEAPVWLGIPSNFGHVYIRKRLRCPLVVREWIYLFRKFKALPSMKRICPFVAPLCLGKKAQATEHT